MREIKSCPREFRGMRVDNGKWAYGWYGFAEGKPYIADWDKGFAYDFGDGTKGNEWHIEVIPETVGQYTGIKDKNSVEIYKGDIVEYFQFSAICEKCNHRSKSIDEVKFNALGVMVSSYRILDPNSDISELEIIGNIHENKKLLDSVRA